MMSTFLERCAIPAAVLAAALLLPAVALRAEAPFTIAVIPDTQYLVRDNSAAFSAETNWIKAHQSDRNIVFVTHEGDIVDTYNDTTQWSRANTAMNILDTTSIPWGVTPGNHDSNSGADYTYYNTNFGPSTSHFSGKSWYGGASAQYGNSYQRFTANGSRQFLSIELDSYNYAYSATWAQSVISSNPGVPTVITTHNYLIPGGLTRFSGDPGGATSPNGPGYYFWNNLIKNNPQIFMVLNGHTDTSRFQESTNTAGGRVFEVLADYQFFSGNGTQGYLRLITFNPDTNNIHISTVSSASNTEMLTSPQTINGHTWDYNNVDFSKLPEPATLSLLVIGGLAAIGRRRGRQRR